MGEKILYSIITAIIIVTIIHFLKKMKPLKNVFKNNFFKKTSSKEKVSYSEIPKDSETTGNKLSELESEIRLLTEKIEAHFLSDQEDIDNESIVQKLDREIQQLLKELNEQDSEEVSLNRQLKQLERELQEAKAKKQNEPDFNNIQLTEEIINSICNSDSNYELLRKHFSNGNQTEEAAIAFSENENKVLYAEALISQGKRKQIENNKELGEDACGFIHYGDFLFSWVLDGESDGEIIPDNEGNQLFSPRALAQDVGSFMGDTILSLDLSSIELLSILKTVLIKVENKWMKNYPLTKGVFKEKFYGTTLILSCYNKVTYQLHTLRVGDSILVPFDFSDNFINCEAANLELPPKSLYARLKQEGVKTILPKEGDIKIETLSNVKTFFLFSDGLSKRAKELIKMNLSENTLNEMRDKFSDMDYKNPDDKALVIVQIREK